MYDPFKSLPITAIWQEDKYAEERERGEGEESLFWRVWARLIELCLPATHRRHRYLPACRDGEWQAGVRQAIIIKARDGSLNAPAPPPPPPRSRPGWWTLGPRLLTSPLLPFFFCVCGGGVRLHARGYAREKQDTSTGTDISFRPLILIFFLSGSVFFHLFCPWAALFTMEI